MTSLCFQFYPFRRASAGHAISTWNSVGSKPYLLLILLYAHSPLLLSESWIWILKSLLYLVSYWPKILPPQYSLSVQFSRSVVSNSLRLHGLQHARPPHPWPTPRVCSNSCPFSDAIQPSHPLLFPSPPAFNLSQHQGLFQWVSSLHQVAKVLEFQLSASVLSMNIQDWSLLEWTGWISMQSKGLSRVFSNTTLQKHQFFSAQLSSQSNSHIHTWLLEKS